MASGRGAKRTIAAGASCPATGPVLWRSAGSKRRDRLLRFHPPPLVNLGSSWLLAINVRFGRSLPTVPGHGKLEYVELATLVSTSSCPAVTRGAAKTRRHRRRATRGLGQIERRRCQRFCLNPKRRGIFRLVTSGAEFLRHTRSRAASRRWVESSHVELHEFHNTGICWYRYPPGAFRQRGQMPARVHNCRTKTGSSRSSRYHRRRSRCNGRPPHTPGISGDSRCLRR